MHETRKSSIFLPFTLHWRGLSCKVVSDCKAGWETYFSAYKGRKGNEYSELLVKCWHTCVRKRKESLNGIRPVLWKTILSSLSYSIFTLKSSLSPIAKKWSSSSRAWANWVFLILSGCRRGR